MRMVDLLFEVEASVVILALAGTLPVFSQDRAMLLAQG